MAFGTPQGIPFVSGTRTHYKADQNQQSHPASISMTFTPEKSGLSIRGMFGWSFGPGGAHDLILKATVNGVDVTIDTETLQSIYSGPADVNVITLPYLGAKQVTPGVPVTVVLLTEDEVSGGSSDAMVLEVTEVDFASYEEVEFTDIP